MGPNLTGLAVVLLQMRDMAVGGIPLQMRDMAVEDIFETIRRQGRRTMMIVMRQVDHAAFVVIIAG